MCCSTSKHSVSFGFVYPPDIDLQFHNIVVEKNTTDDFSLLKLGFVCAQKRSFLETFCVLEGNACSCCCCCCGTQSPLPSLSAARSAVSLLISCRDDPSFGESEVLKFPTLIVLLSISPCSSVNICFIHFGELMLGAYILIIAVSSG